MKRASLPRRSRRQVITLLGGAAAPWPLAARAQQRERIGRVGVLTPFPADDAEGQARLTAFAQALQQAGWTLGQNLRLDYRWGDGKAETMRKHAAELAALAPDVILANSSAAVSPLLQVTRTVPIVFAGVADPVGAGYVESLARPGGNATGFTALEYSFAGKWLELMKEMAPRITRLAVLRDSAIAAGPGQFGVLQAFAPSLGLELRPIDVRDAGEIERSINAFTQGGNGGLVVTGSPAATGSSRPDRRARGAQPAPGRLLRPVLLHRRRPDLLWSRFPRPIPARGGLCGSHPPRRKACRSAGAGTDQVRAGHKSQDREGSRPHGAG